MTTSVMYRFEDPVGTRSYKLAANEVAIGHTMPHAAVEILRHRLAPSPFYRAALLAETFSPANAIGAGFLDRVVEPSDLQAVVHRAAVEMSKLDMASHAATKLRARAHVLTAIKAGLDADVAALRTPASSPQTGASIGSRYAQSQTANARTP